MWYYNGTFKDWVSKTKEIVFCFGHWAEFEFFEIEVLSFWNDSLVFCEIHKVVKMLEKEIPIV
jgi:hypothetical protein